MTIGDNPIDADAEPRGEEQAEHPPPRPPRPIALARATAAWTLAVVSVAAGIGWLYLLRGAGALAHGPLLVDALPLQQLASHSAQPLLRVAVAWVPSGAAAGLALGWIGRVGLVRRSVGLGVVAALVVLASSAASGAIARNQTLGRHVVPTFTHSGVWVEVACVVIGSLLAAPAARDAPRDGAAAASAA